MAASRSASAFSALVDVLSSAPSAPALVPLPVPSFTAAARGVNVSAPCTILGARWDGAGRVFLSTSRGVSTCVLSYASSARGRALAGDKVAAYLNSLAGRSVVLYTADLGKGYTAFPGGDRGFFAAVGDPS